ncbi:NADP-dependent oxidoreductase [Sphingosinicella ginsenosidimutans]|uniref:NADP-dependent oxidoreductase n=1 Tax=Allosphingosinicella ginsenosidimutans TaxID=1176539 RepID=A0A5C6TSW6_9SPHN|nr:NADP-dependent oxidoreductase [Sphingosinicella ginsenosidimutans]TXC63005.1 NADP-dependent oxidoreductase [Sphingosinicella ginsenosidimutans]
MSNRAWHLVARPTGLPTMENFALRELAREPLADGEVRVRNLWLSVDPYMRGRMNDAKSYAAPFALGEPMQGGAVGRVVESRAEGFAEGDLVLHMLGWREEAVAPAKAFTRLPAIDVGAEQWLGNLGLTGATAYFGLLDVAAAKPGETVFVSAAAGAVGSAVVQIAKAKGMTVIGSAGGAEKCAFVRELGADAAIDYKGGRIDRLLAEAAPDGIDVYFDNVGGDHLDAALAAARLNARFAICGMIEDYNSGSNHVFRYVTRIIAARIRIQGFLYFDFMDRMADFHRDMTGWIASGAVRSRETIHDGIESAPAAFLDLFSGGNIGKMLVRLPG